MPTYDSNAKQVFAELDRAEIQKGDLVHFDNDGTETTAIVLDIIPRVSGEPGSIIKTTIGWIDSRSVLPRRDTHQ